MQKSKLMSTLALGTVLSLSACGGSQAKVDPEIMAALENVVQKCKVDVSGNTVTECKDNAFKDLRAMFSKNPKEGIPKKDKFEALDTFSTALKSENKELAVAASSLLYNEYRTLGTEPDTTKLKPDAAKRMIEAVGQSPQYQAAQSLKAAVHTAMLTQQSEALYQMMDNHSYDSIPGLGYPHIMRYGRLDAFPKIKSLADAEDPKLVSAAFKAPRNMYKPSPEEMAPVCQWAKGYLSDSRDAAYNGAARLMIKCQGEYIDALLEEGEKRLKENNRFTRDDYLVYRDVCFSPVKGLIKEAGFQAQCKRTAEFLEAAVNNEKVASRDRGLALFAIYYQRRNADSMKIMQKYKEHPDENIRKYANESIKSLKEVYKIPES